MLLAVDIGNTHITIGLFKGKDIVNNLRISTDIKKTEDEYATSILYPLSKIGIDASHVKSVVISSVVPTLTVIFRKLSFRYLDIEPMIVDINTKTQISLKVDNPKEIGVDRIVNAVAIQKLYGVPAIVVDFGTATTFDVISKDNEYIGGIITPGIELVSHVLHAKTAKLPEVEIAKIENIIGKNTIDSMKSGIYYGYLSMIDGIIERVIESGLIGKDMHIVSTGGYGDIFVEDSKFIERYEPLLTLIGLKIIYEENCI
ncbi:MAG: type III pantothenate kinase [Deferribacterota bacterium]|nr:type III pantothenate kinase [Deferribacterota bacterium]